MVFQFEHVGLDQGATKWDVHPLRLTDLKRSFGRWQRGLAERGWNSLYWNNHDQPRVVSRFGDDGAHRVRSAKLLGTVLHLHRGTPYVYQGEELGMTNFPFAGHRRLPRHRVAQPLRRARRRRRRPGRRCSPRMRAMSRDNARTPMQWDALAARRLHDRHAVDRRQPEPRRDQRGGGARRPRLGLPPLPPPDRAAPHRAGGRPRRLHDAARGRRARLRVHAPRTRTSSCSSWRNFSGEPVADDVPGWDGAELLLGNCRPRPGPRCSRGRRGCIGERQLRLGEEAGVRRGAVIVELVALYDIKVDTSRPARRSPTQPGLTFAEDHALGGREHVDRPVRAIGVGGEHERAVQGQPAPARCRS